MDLSGFLLERVFLYLNWNDRSRAARVCRKWLEIFHSPSLWRTMVIRRPNRTLSRVQYDMRAYYLSCCLRTIGWYVKTYRFLPTEDIFLLNRSLSVIAKFFECNSAPAGAQTKPADSDEDYATEADNGDDALAAGSLETSPSQSNETRLSDYLGAIQGDPDAEATLRLILKMQAREYLGLSSESDDEEGDSWAAEVDFPGQFIRQHGSLPTAQFSRPTPAPGLQRSIQRSVSYRRPQHERRRPAPTVMNFSLDFYCEIDEARGHIYGTGGVLLSTIQRMVRQLTALQCLKLTNLFLTPADARRLVAGIAEVAAASLTDLNLTHLNKPLPETELVHSTGLSLPTAAGSDWYLLDPRWLGAHPHRSRENPLAELAVLFPHLTRLSLAITQLTGPMLLRLLHQTCLREICFVQTEFTAFTLPGWGLDSWETSGLPPADQHLGPEESPWEDHFLDPMEVAGEAAIDWGGDVPQFIPGHMTSADWSLLHRLTVPHGWRPITSKEWSAALVLRPQLSLILNLVSAGRLLQELPSSVDLWPQPPAPVRTVVVSTPRGVSEAMRLAFPLTLPVTLSSYRDTLTGLVVCIQSNPPSPSTGRCSAELNEAIFKICSSCHLLRHLAFGGSPAYLALTTLFNICRLCQRRAGHSEARSACRLVVEAGSCCLSGDGGWGVPGEGGRSGTPSDHLSATTSTWCAMVLEAGPAVGPRMVAAERCISTALGQPRWKFLMPGQFQSYLSTWLSSTG